MDKRKTQRILGILVIIALVIILFPLLFNKNEVATQTTSVIAPTFPDTPNNSAVTTAENQDSTNPAPIAESTTTNADDNVVSDNAISETKHDDLVPVATMDPADQAANMNSADTTTPPAVAQDPQPTAELNTAPIDQSSIVKPSNEQAQTDKPSNIEPVTLNNEEDASPQVNAPVPVKKSTTKSSRNKTKSVHKPIVHEVAKLNKAAWIVQMGSFKNKNNALGLTNKLRAAGFKAFTKEVKTAKGSTRTHVYIGPEFKEAHATKISRKIQHDMNLQGIVLPYKPLAL